MKTTADNVSTVVCLRFSVNFHFHRAGDVLTSVRRQASERFGHMTSSSRPAGGDHVTAFVVSAPHGRCAAMSSSSSSSSLLSSLWVIFPDGRHPWPSRADREYLFNAFRLKETLFEPSAGLIDDWKVSCDAPACFPLCFAVGIGLINKFPTQSQDLCSVQAKWNGCMRRRNARLIKSCLNFQESECKHDINKRRQCYKGINEADKRAPKPYHRYDVTPTSVRWTLLGIW